MKSKELTEVVRKILDDKKGKEIEIIDLEGKTILADYFIIVTGTSTPNVRALSEEVQIKLKEDYDIEPLHVEGHESGKWILLDYGDIVIHVFQENERNFYSLEKLWQGRKRK